MHLWYICWVSGLLYSMSGVWCAFRGRDGWMRVCVAAVKWGYSATVSLKGRWCVSVHPGIEPILIDERAVRLEYQACKWSHHYRSALSLKWNTQNPLLHYPVSSSSSPFPPTNRLFPRLQSKMTTTRSSGDIAMDLTEICAPRISKLSSIQSKDQLIMASNGSLISAGTQRVNQLMAPVPRQIVSDDLLL